MISCCGSGAGGKSAGPALNEVPHKNDGPLGRGTASSCLRFRGKGGAGAGWGGAGAGGGAGDDGAGAGAVRCTR
eukprot:4658988-Prymnesium_polylepis.1